LITVEKIYLGKRVWPAVHSSILAIFPGVNESYQLIMKQNTVVTYKE